MVEFIVRLPVRVKGPISAIIIPNKNIKAVLVNEKFPGRCTIVIEDGEKYCIPYKPDIVSAHVFGGMAIPEDEPIDPMTEEG